MLCIPAVSHGQYHVSFEPYLLSDQWIRLLVIHIITTHSKLISQCLGSFLVFLLLP